MIKPPFSNVCKGLRAVKSRSVSASRGIDNAMLIQELRSDSFRSLQGLVKFGPDGENTVGVPFLFQWQNARLIPVYPLFNAQANPEFPKKQWPA